MRKTTITLLSSTYGTVNDIYRQLSDLFRDLVDIRTVVFTDNPEVHSVSDELVVITDKTIEKQAMLYVKPGTQVIVADCTIKIDTIGRLYDIPENTKVLLANTTRETTFEALRQLKERGIQHLHFHPYYPGIRSYEKNCTYAIVFGERQLVPQGADQVVDLGSRPFDITSCIKIAIQAGIFDEIKNTISSAFMRSGIELAYSYSRQYRKNRILTGNLQQIVNKFKSGVIMLGDDHSIVLHNPRAGKLLRIKEGRSQYMPALLNRFKSEGETFFFEIDGFSFYVEAVSTISEGSENIIFIINDVENIEKIEKDYRLMLLKDGLVAQYTFEDIVYESDAMRLLIQKSRQFAKSDSTVAIYGESGCGKELIAQALHNASERKNEAFVAVNFAALSSTLSEAELFGYVDGAFTGAKKGGKKGLFELAHKGTIFLDEIGDCSLDIQKKILRVLQERKVMPIGGSRVIPVDIRIITATNQDLYQMVKHKQFREDLYYRLSVLPLRVPPLRERREDILPLFRYFLKDNFGTGIIDMPLSVQESLLNHSWRGNVRELRNVAEYISNCIRSHVSWEEQLEEILWDGNDTEVDAEHRNASSGEQEWEELVSTLESHCNLEALYNLLMKIGESQQKWSRKKLAAALDTFQDQSMTESRIKRYLSILKKFELVESKTGEGSYIKQKGRDFLKYLENR